MGQTTQIRNWAVWLLGGLIALLVVGCEEIEEFAPLDPLVLTDPMPPPASIEMVGNGHHPTLSADGRFVGLSAYADVLGTRSNQLFSDIHVLDRLTGESNRVSISPDGFGGVGESFNPSISADGRFVAFYSGATNLVAGDTNGKADIFVHDRTMGETTIVSVDSFGNQASASSAFPSISADGRFVAFHSGATNLVAGDTNGKADIFVHDRTTGETTRVSVDSAGNQIGIFSHDSSISADGRFVAFNSGNVLNYVHDRITGETTLVSVDSAGNPGNNVSANPSISADGRFVSFVSSATNLVPGDTNGAADVFVHDLLTGETTRVSVDSNGIQGDMDSNGIPGDIYSGTPTISADGRFVAFSSIATNLVPGDTNSAADVFVHDRVTGETVRLSVNSAGAEGDGPNGNPFISADGRALAFTSGATNLITGDDNYASDIFITPNTMSTFDPLADDDGDGLINNQELMETFTHYFKADSDGDGVDDGIEWGNGTDPLDPDSF